MIQREIYKREYVELVNTCKKSLVEICEETISDLRMGGTCTFEFEDWDIVLSKKTPVRKS